jgi:hypothetical protein
MILQKIITGGQSGVDITATETAHELGVLTGGFIPKGHSVKSEKVDYSNDILKSLFGFSELENNDWEEAQIKNVKVANATVIFGYTKSEGSLLTIKTCREIQQFYLVNPGYEMLARFINYHHIHQLNVAGNRDSIRNPRVCEQTYKVIHGCILKLSGL